MKFLVNDKNKKALLTDDFDPQARKQTYQELAELIKKHAMSDAIFGVCLAHFQIDQVLMKLSETIYWSHHEIHSVSTIYRCRANRGRP